jgi:hypothetical protein
MTVLAAALAAVVMAGRGCRHSSASPRHRDPLRRAQASTALPPLLAYFTLVFLFLVVGLMVACWFRRGATVGNSLLLRSPRWRLWQYAAFAS